MSNSENLPVSVVKVLPGGRVTIPKDLRELLELNNGDRMAVYLNENTRGIIYVPVPHPRLSSNPR